MNTNIKCPSCGKLFALGEAEVEEYKKELRKAMQAYKDKKDSEIKIREEEFEREKILIQSATQKKITEELLQKMRSLEEESNQKSLQLQLFQKKELELLREKTSLEEKQRSMEYEIEKRVLESRRSVEQKTLQQANEKFDLERKEFEIQMAQQKKLIEEMNKKANQGSMQTQGEAQEHLIEEILQETFPYDVICEVAKGKKGADCILCIKNKFGNDCGKILFESKRTGGWGKDWIDKLKQDAVNSGVNAAVLVSQVLPDTMTDRFEYNDGVWICGFSDIKLLTASLREGIIHVFNVSKKHEGKGDKVQMLYEYMTSNEFSSQWRNIRAVFKNMQSSIQKEREVMEKLWKNREKQLDRALLNSDHIIGSIEGIAGKDSIDIDKLDYATDISLEND
ncbi:MAG: DUF2130 domain-containing protein [Chitinophagaceae bacterium]